MPYSNSKPITQANLYKRFNLGCSKFNRMRTASWRLVQWADSLGSPLFKNTALATFVNNDFTWRQ